MYRKLCPICGTGKQKMKCQLQQNKLICAACCEAAHNLLCNGCQNYLDSERLFFHCRTCEATEDGEETGVLARHLHIPLFPVQGLEGPISPEGWMICGESYQTKLTFPFEGRIDTPFWLLVHRVFDLSSMQFVCAEILDILSRDHYQAQVEVMATQVIPLDNVPEAFPGSDLNCTPPDPIDVFPLPLTVESRGAHTICRSLCQDGGVWAVFTDTNSGPTLTLFAQGWFNHWKYLGGHLRLERDFYLRLLKGEGQ